MNVLLLGATGKTGRALTEKLLADTDCNVTLFARHIDEGFADDPRATAVRGDAAHADELRAVLKGHDVVYCAISGGQLPAIARNLVAAMDEAGMRRLVFMAAVGIYNEIPDNLGGQYNVDNEPPQVPNRQAADIVESSGLDYTILRPGFLRPGEADDFVLTFKGEPAKGYITTLPSVVDLAVRLIQDDSLYVRESVSITRNMAE